MTVHPGIMLRKEDQRGELSYLYQIDDKDDNHDGNDDMGLPQQQI